MLGSDKWISDDDLDIASNVLVSERYFCKFIKRGLYIEFYTDDNMIVSISKEFFENIILSIDSGNTPIGVFKSRVDILYHRIITETTEMNFELKHYESC